MKLNQIIAIESSSKARRHSFMSEVYKRIQKPDLFTGHTRVYHRRDEDSEDLPPETKNVQHTVVSILQETQAVLQEHFSVIAQKDWGNCTARGQLIVDGVVVAADIPVTYLLFLEKELTDVRTFLETLPVPENTEHWYEDPTTGLYKTDPVPTHRTKKVQRPIVLYDATEHHPAQTQLITEDVIAGTWHTTKYSSGLSAVRKAQLVSRVEKLIRAVKLAREEANTMELTATPTIGEAVLGYLFA